MQNAKLDTGLVPKLFLDPGVSRHMTNEISLLTNIRTVKELIKMVLGTLVYVQCVGTMRSEVTVDGRHHTIGMKEVAYLPDLKTDILSKRRLQKKDFNPTF